MGRDLARCHDLRLVARIPVERIDHTSGFAYRRFGSLKGSNSEMGDPTLVEAFSAIFQVPASKVHITTNSAFSHTAVHDGELGVQWMVTYKWLNKNMHLGGVNLEGLEYDGWLIARFIERELDQPRLRELVASASEAEVVWFRDAWTAGGSRVPIQGRIIGGKAFPIWELDANTWADLLHGAYGCLAVDKNHRGRALQRLETGEGHSELFVSPHLQIRVPSRAKSRCASTLPTS